MFSNKNAYATSRYLVARTNSNVQLARLNLIKILINCSHLINQIREKIKIVDLAYPQDIDLIFLLKKLKQYMIHLSNAHAKAYKDVNMSMWLKLDEVRQLIKSNRIFYLDITLLATFKYDEEKILTLQYKLNEEIASLVTPALNANVSENSRYKLFLKHGGINSFIAALHNIQLIQYKIATNGMLIDKKEAYIHFYLAALLIYIGEENLKQFYSLCKQNTILSQDFMELFLTTIWPSEVGAKFKFSKRDIIFLLNQGDIFLISMVLEKSDTESIELMLNTLLEYPSPHFKYANKLICEAVTSTVKHLDQDLLYKLLLLTIKNLDEYMFDRLISLCDGSSFIKLFFEILNSSPSQYSVESYKKIILQFLKLNDSLIETQQKDKNIYPFLILLLDGNPVKEKLASVILLKSSIDLRRQYLIWLYKHSNEINLLHCLKVLLSALSVDDILFVIRTCEVTIPSVLHNLLEKRYPVEYLTYAIKQSKNLEEDFYNIILFGLPEHWCPENLLNIAHLKEHGHELIKTASLSFDIFLRELTLRIVENYLVKMLGNVGYKEMLAEYELENTIVGDPKSKAQVACYSFIPEQSVRSKRNTSTKAAGETPFSGATTSKKQRKDKAKVNKEKSEVESANVNNEVSGVLTTDTTDYYHCFENHPFLIFYTANPPTNSIVESYAPYLSRNT